MKIKFKWPEALLIGFITLFIISCGGSGGGGSSSEAGGSGVTTATFAGTWQTGCVDSSGLGTTYIITSSVYGAAGSGGAGPNGGTLVDTIVFYSDPVCATPTGITKVNTGTYLLGTEITTTGGLSAAEIDVTYSSVLYPSGTTLPTVTNYGIVRIDGTWMYTSNALAATPGARPNQLDMTNHATKQ